MKYKIWDRINNRYDESKYIDKDGEIKDKSKLSFNINNFNVIWIYQHGDDIVDSKIFEIIESEDDSLSEINYELTKLEDLLLECKKDLSNDSCFTDALNLKNHIFSCIEKNMVNIIIMKNNFMRRNFYLSKNNDKDIKK